MPPRILAFAGSSRRESLNRKLLTEAVDGARAAGAEVTVLRLADLALPVYDGDHEDEHGFPAGALEFKRQITEHDALLIASPEHNGGYTAQLKNALDWASRPTETDRTGLGAFKGKFAAVISASPGLLGGLRSQTALQISLHKIGLTVIPENIALGSAHQAFDDEGRIKDERSRRSTHGVGEALARAAHTSQSKA
ncbi:NAD(P)H-dependent oxidoreductase [Luteibacter anthropi]|uniref:NAD(P)H-dependent oxidoreductase n=1 Tax=Luteibacter anthropi TaxID=564369 RepID=A0A7X5UB50_9GAMM|nr:NAD(P)H-dependent oxidoreductase [Luteibacter anthropi]NII07067.1 NAD(P)H-dependent oxidoreductase [Luteibacter anthropi]URX62334.1 NAD(P)H-dependent oxidoreductase [Luteibacter anthropi]